MNAPIPLTGAQKRELHTLTEHPAFGALNALIDYKVGHKQLEMLASDGGEVFRRLQIECSALEELATSLRTYAEKPDDET